MTYEDDQVCPEGRMTFGVMRLKHFSPCTIFDRLTEEWKDKFEDLMGNLTAEEREVFEKFLGKLTEKKKTGTEGFGLETGLTGLLIMTLEVLFILVRCKKIR